MRRNTTLLEFRTRTALGDRTYTVLGLRVASQQVAEEVHNNMTS